jgi:hypothetical protein
MKRIFTLMVLVSCTMMEVHAQLTTPPAWNKNIGGSQHEYSANVISTGNQIVIAGYTLSWDYDLTGHDPSSGDFFWMQMDQNGNLQRLRTYGGSKAELPRFMIRTAEGGFLLVGSTQSLDGDAENSGLENHIRPGEDIPQPDIWVVKINSRGAIEWQRAYGGFGGDEGWSVTQTDDNGDGRKDDGYAIVGWTQSNNNGDVTNFKGSQDAWVIKISATGDLQWQKTLGGTRAEYGRRIEQTPDGGYIVLNETYSWDGDVVGYHAGGNGLFSDIWIVKLDASGQNILWQKTYGGDFNDVGFSLRLTDDDGDGQKDDGFIIAAGAESSNGTMPPRDANQVGYDIITMKYDLSGNLQWHARFGGTRSDRGYDVVQTNDGGYAVIGSTESYSGDLEGLPSKGDVDIVLLKYTANGNLQFKQRFGGSKSDNGIAIAQSPDDCIILMSDAKSSDGDVPGHYGSDERFDIWLMKWCEPVQLPVTLTDFKAQYQGNGKAILEWRTASEQNNDRFEIQRSVDGQNFNAIGTVAGSGTTSHTLTYAYTDQGVDALNADIVYYRLRQVDIDGKSELSQVVMVRPKIQNGADVRVWPNPSEGRFQVQLKNAPSGPVKATIYSASGKVIKTTTFRNVTSEIDLSGQSAGTYFIRLEDNKGWVQVQPVVVK